MRLGGEMAHVFTGLGWADVAADCLCAKTLRFDSEPRHREIDKQPVYVAHESNLKITLTHKALCFQFQR